MTFLAISYDKGHDKNPEANCSTLNKYVPVFSPMEGNVYNLEPAYHQWYDYGNTDYAQYTVYVRRVHSGG